jgi:hypothetical protein
MRDPLFSKEEEKEPQCQHELTHLYKSYSCKSRLSHKHYRGSNTRKLCYNCGTRQSFHFINSTYLSTTSPHTLHSTLDHSILSSTLFTKTPSLRTCISQSSTVPSIRSHLGSKDNQTKRSLQILHSTHEDITFGQTDSLYRDVLILLTYDELLNKYIGNFASAPEVRPKKIQRIRRSHSRHLRNQLRHHRQSAPRLKPLPQEEPHTHPTKENHSQSGRTTNLHKLRSARRSSLGQGRFPLRREITLEQDILLPRPLLPPS